MCMHTTGAYLHSSETDVLNEYRVLVCISRDPGFLAFAIIKDSAIAEKQIHSTSSDPGPSWIVCQRWDMLEQDRRIFQKVKNACEVSEPSANSFSFSFPAKIQICSRSKIFSTVNQFCIVYFFFFCWLLCYRKCNTLLRTVFANCKHLLVFSIQNKVHLIQHSPLCMTVRWQTKKAKKKRFS